MSDRAALIAQFSARLVASGAPLSDLQGLIDFLDSWIETRSSSPLSSQIQGARKRQGWTLTRLSAEAGISRQNISLWEAGTHLPTVSSLQKIARALQVSFNIFDEGALSHLPQNSADIDRTVEAGSPPVSAGLNPR